jgi:hypothetical protein
VSFSAVASAPRRFRAHPKLRLPGQPQTRHYFATLLSVARRGYTSPDRGIHHQFERCLALSKVRWADASHRKTYNCGAPAPFSADPGCRRRMRRRSTLRNFCVPRLATSLSVSLSNQSLFSSLRGHPHRTTFELSATLILSRLAAVLFCATPGHRQTYPRSIEFA